MTPSSQTAARATAHGPPSARCLAPSDTGRLRWDSANRSFFALVATALVPYVLFGVFGCGLLSVAAHRVATDGLSGLTRDGEDLRPGAVFFAVVTAGTIAAALSVYRQVRATRALAGALRERTVTAPAKVTAAAERSGLAGWVDVIDDPARFSFTYGVATARVALSRGLVDSTRAEELAHEAYHVRNRDTLKMVIAKAAPAAFFFLPALAHLRLLFPHSLSPAPDTIDHLPGIPT